MTTSTPERIRLTRIFRFETAHALLNYDGACRNIHGHSYKLEVTVSGAPINNSENPKNGMVHDFGDLKKLVEEKVIKDFDHALLLNQSTSAEIIEPLQKHYEKVLLLSYQPTSELMLLDIKNRILPALAPEIALCRLKLSETENSYAEWLATDNNQV